MTYTTTCPKTAIGRVRNRHEFAGILAFDKWTCNADGRQVAFWKRLRERKFAATFIDQGYSGLLRPQARKGSM